MLKKIFGKSSTATVTPQDVQKRIESGENLFVLDVRQPEEYKEVHVAGSTLIPLPDLAMRLSEVPRDQTIVAICRSGNRSGVAMSMLARAGFHEVANLEGGIIAWQKQGLPVERGR